MPAGRNETLHEHISQQFWFSIVLQSLRVYGSRKYTRCIIGAYLSGPEDVRVLAYLVGHVAQAGADVRRMFADVTDHRNSLGTTSNTMKYTQA